MQHKKVKDSAGPRIKGGEVERGETYFHLFGGGQRRNAEEGFTPSDKTEKPRLYAGHKQRGGGEGVKNQYIL